MHARSLLRTFLALGLFVAASATGVLAQLQYPEGAATPRYLTDEERAWMAANPTWNLRGSTPPPTGPVRCVAEYEPMDGLLIAWEGPTAHLNILAQIARYATTTGAANMYCVLDTTSEQTSASATISAAGADMSRVKFLVRTTDTIWIRDYGPRYILEGNCRAIVDHIYNRVRPNDDIFSAFFATYKGHTLYEIPLTHGGGNFHLDALGRSNATRLVVNENPGLSETQIHNLWQSYQNVDTTLYDGFPTTIDSTQHIDMWMQVAADNVVLISDFGTPTPGTALATADTICEGAATLLGSRGYTVHRLPALSSGGTHYTFTNSVMCNNVVMIPSYASFTTQSTQALNTWRAAVPGKTVVQINCDGIIASAGALHCIVMHVPLAPGGAVPTAYLKTPPGGQTYAPAAPIDVMWNADDDVAVTGIDIALSLDGGLTFPVTLASNIAHDGAELVSAPNVATTRGRIRVTARDAAGNVGSDMSATNITITGTPCPGDLNADRAVDESDLGILLTGWQQDGRGDTDGDDDTDEADLGTLLANWQATCP
ncbi:MAG: agmatine deiminase family protein [Phycisphaerae bacterium]